MLGREEGGVIREKIVATKEAVPKMMHHGASCTKHPGTGADIELMLNGISETIFS